MESPYRRAGYGLCLRSKRGVETEMLWRLEMAATLFLSKIMLTLEKVVTVVTVVTGVVVAMVLA